MKKRHFIRLVLLLVCISLVHLLIPRQWLFLHVVFRMLYLIPIAYAGLVAGKKAGLVTAAISSLLFLPHFLIGRADAVFHAGNIVAIIIFLALGYISGSYRSTQERSYTSAKTRSYEQTQRRLKKRILFYIDESQLCTVAAEWLVEHLADKTTTLIKLFAVNIEEVDELFASKTEAREHVGEKHAAAAATMDRVKTILSEGGVAEPNIKTEIVGADRKTRFSDMVLKELDRADYEFVVVEKHQTSKAQEFLFGDVAVKLIRESPVPVVVVKGKEVEQAQTS